ncbi:hypothetical protein Aasi_1294 [Candidatus Amoebophilus asiaticus 5a2]|uniref:Uncharacterized protein n=1 Tax=Amoebophilus asiaticus (strain 5a2) TaxID=452471 RepID=B3ETQ6_AMOA5|nr:type II toxin-antitoxin system RelE/ParE family toxin [Candidatus Amoebophilus asiaticus]ACE06608.1 hypothetical protein Aasi_1294 [Candidatus Amoebophilus asiaticus 5a2]
MNYNVKSTNVFERQAKRLIKKYASLKQELFQLVQQLKDNPKLGTAIGGECYKIRISVASKGKGNSSGARVITNFVVTDNTVYLLYIYDKSDQETLSDKELKELLKCINI